jgi:hypothetical protein
MAPKFGNYLFRNQKGEGPEAGAKQSEALGTLEEQVIVLKCDDLAMDGPGAPLLDWSKVPAQTIRVQLRDTEGILEGRVTIKATVLHGICPELFVKPPEKEHLFPVSLKRVVLQIQTHFKKNQRETVKAAGPDFDTPIAQVAREDEGFFKLEENAPRPESTAEAPAPQGPAAPILTPADRPAFPLIREKSLPIDAVIEKGPEALNVSVRPPVPCFAAVERPRIDLFQHLPKVGPQPGSSKIEPVQEGPGSTEDRASVGNRPAPEGSVASGPKTSKLSRQSGLERLQEIFLTDNLLDASQVAQLVSDFPRVKATLILLGDGTAMGGELPEGYSLETARAVPDIVRAVQQFTAHLNGEEVVGLTILGHFPISLFSHGCMSLILVHEGRGLLPGMRERITDVVRALHLLYDGLEIEQ